MDLETVERLARECAARAETFELERVKLDAGGCRVKVAFRHRGRPAAHIEYCDEADELAAAERVLRTTLTMLAHEPAPKAPEPEPLEAPPAPPEAVGDDEH